MFTKHLNAKLVSEGKNVRVLSFHPGIVKTELYDRDAKWITVRPETFWRQVARRVTLEHPG
jgi:NAD(P)-dependent dehydrogenase (short-subunit alcohol dehydrogenase family)